MSYSIFSVSMSVIRTSPLESNGGLNQNMLNGADSTSSIVLLKRKKKACPNNVVKVFNYNLLYLKYFRIILCQKFVEIFIDNFFSLKKPARNAASLSSFVGTTNDQVNLS